MIPTGHALPQSWSSNSNMLSIWLGSDVRHKARDKERWQAWSTHSSCTSFCSAGASRRLKTLWTDASLSTRAIPTRCREESATWRPSTFQGIFEIIPPGILWRTAGAREEITCVNLRTDLVKTLFASWHQPFFSETWQFCQQASSFLQGSLNLGD